MPLKQYHFDLTKSEFRDGIALRFGWDPEKMPSLCACNEKLHCGTCAALSERRIHAHERQWTSRFLCELVKWCQAWLKSNLIFSRCKGKLLLSTTTDDDARLDIKATRLWESRFNKTYFDVKIFNPLAKSCPESSSEAYKYHESIIKNKYEQRITEVEKATFCPLVFACTGGAGASASKVLKQLASTLSARKDDSYADISYLRTKISFALLRSSILCMRGSKTLRRSEIVDASMGAVKKGSC